jgi:hypothetical protein
MSSERILHEDCTRQHMPTYLVDRDLPGVTLVELAEAQGRLLAAVEQTAQTGQAVRYLHSTFVPGESHLMCLFEASSAAVVMKVNEAARFPLLRVIEALDVTPQGATLERSGEGRSR